MSGLVARAMISGFAMLCTATLSGCAQHRLAMDYQIKVDREFAVEHIKETEVFFTGEKFRLRVTTHDDGYVYILNEGTSGAYNVLYPRPEVRDGSARVPALEYVIVPVHGSFQFDVNAGVETIIVYYSKEAVPALDRIVHGVLTDPEQIEQCLHDLEAHSRRGSSFKKVHHPNHTQVEQMSPRRDVVMVNTIRLAHRPPPS